MHTRQSTRRIAGIVGIALVLMTASFGGTSAEDSASSSASLSPAVSTFLESSAPDATLDVIVTFHGADGLARLDGLGVASERLRSVPMANSMLSADQIREVASWPETRSVYDNAALELYLDEGTRLIHADDVWAGEGRLSRPYTGAGVGVAVLDTGIDATHPDLLYGAKTVRNFYVAGDPLAPDDNDTLYPESPLTDTEHGHGTHVASTVAGTGAASGGKFQGVAPGAHLVGFKVGAGASVLTWWAARAFDWILENGEEHNIRVVSNSWGGGDGNDYDPDDPINVLTKECYLKDIVVVFAASNSGGPNKLNRYAVSPYVVSVGAVDKESRLASFSSTGRPGGDMVRDENGLYRPTVTAPGVDITAAHSSGGAVMYADVDPEHPQYATISGTSMATPHVSGVVALMLEARGALSAQNVIDILEGTATDMPDYEAWEVGAGLVDAYAATVAAERGQIHFPPTTKGKTPGYTLREGLEWTGTVLPAGYVLQDVSKSTIHETPVEVGDGVDALYAQIGWESMLENVYLRIKDPSGAVVAESAGLLDIGSVNFRTAVVTNPAPGTWTISVEGRVNAITDYEGFYGLYDETKKTREPTGTTVAETTSFEGLSGPGVDPASDRDYHTITVPEGTTAVEVSVAWTSGSTDIDLWVYDSTGRVVGSSTSGSGTSESTRITTSDPMTGAIEPGEWTIEVRGWLAVAESYRGTATVERVA